MKIKLLLFILLICSSLWAQDILLDLYNAGVEISREIDKAVLEATALTDAEENQLGAQIRTEIIKTERPCTHSRFPVNEIFRKVVANASRQGLDWECTIVSNSEFNAFAIAGGKVFINKGLLDAVGSEAELAFVIGHEIAHIDLKHCVYKIQHGVRAGQIDPNLGELVQIGYDIYSRPFSQPQEQEADELGFRLMRRAGYPKQGALDFFRRLEQFEPKIEDPTINAVNDFISTHPTARRRLERMQQLD
jgi:predicted Zn-dependent protease